MNNEDLVARYVSNVLDARDEGRELDLAELCRDRPELISAVEAVLALNETLSGESSADPLIGAVLDDRYALSAKIGEGAMGATGPSPAAVGARIF